MAYIDGRCIRGVAQGEYVEGEERKPWVKSPNTIIRGIKRNLEGRSRSSQRSKKNTKREKYHRSQGNCVSRKRKIK